MSATAISAIPAAQRFFSKVQPDLRSRKSIVDFLTGHSRYDTMNSCNRSTAYAQCVKVPRLGLTSEQEDRAYEMLNVDDGMDFITQRINEFTRLQGGAYTAGTNGRCGGYLVMYNSYYEPSPHKSRCTHCGQLNFRGVVKLAEHSATDQAIAGVVLAGHSVLDANKYLEADAIVALDIPQDDKRSRIRYWTARRRDENLGLDNRCGRCHNDTRVPYSATTLQVYPGKSIDQDESFEDWGMPQLVERARLVMAFDEMCDKIRADLIEAVQELEVVTETVMVQRKVKVLRPRAA